MTTEEANPHAGGISTPFVRWLEKQKHREDETGRVARYVLSSDHLPHSRPALLEQARTYGEREEYEACLRYGHAASEDSIEVFNRVYDEYVRSGPAGDAYDEKVREAMKRLDEDFGDPQKSDGGKQRAENGNGRPDEGFEEIMSVLRDDATIAAKDEQRRELIAALEAEGILEPNLRRILEGSEALEDAQVRQTVQRWWGGFIGLCEIEDETLQMGLLEEDNNLRKGRAE